MRSSKLFHAMSFLSFCLLPLLLGSLAYGWIPSPTTPGRRRQTCASKKRCLTTTTNLLQQTLRPSYPYDDTTSSWLPLKARRTDSRQYETEKNIDKKKKNKTNVMDDPRTFLYFARPANSGRVGPVYKQVDGRNDDDASGKNDSQNNNKLAAPATAAVVGGAAVSASSTTATTTTGIAATATSAAARTATTAALTGGAAVSATSSSTATAGITTATVASGGAGASATAAAATTATTSTTTTVGAMTATTTSTTIGVAASSSAARTATTLAGTSAAVRTTAAVGGAAVSASTAATTATTTTGATAGITAGISASATGVTTTTAVSSSTIQAAAAATTVSGRAVTTTLAGTSTVTAAAAKRGGAALTTAALATAGVDLVGESASVASSATIVAGEGVAASIGGGAATVAVDTLSVGGTAVGDALTSSSFSSATAGGEAFLGDVAAGIGDSLAGAGDAVLAGAIGIGTDAAVNAATGLVLWTAFSKWLVSGGVIAILVEVAFAVTTIAIAMQASNTNDQLQPLQTLEDPVKEVDLVPANNIDPVENSMNRKEMLQFSGIIVATAAATYVPSARAETDDILSPSSLTTTTLSPVEITPLSPDAKKLFNEGRALESQGNMAAAQRLYGKVTKISPRFIYGWSNLGNTQVAMGDLESADQNYSKAVALCRESQQEQEGTSTFGTKKCNDLYILLLNRGSVRLNTKGMEKEALKDLQQANTLRQRPDAIILQNLARAKELNGLYNGADGDYTLAISMTANEVNPFWLRSAMVKLQLGDIKGGMDLLKRVENRFPEAPEVKAASATFLAQQGDQIDAQRKYLEIPDRQRLKFADDKYLQQVIAWPPAMVEGITKIAKVVGDR